ncbi:MAG: molybdopterin-dependent oxidoreductase [Thaumarchaeota archaeon]|nr:molybdopterin-dependent oxidoreductase [Nitrososphaerota archaeon]
MELASKAKEDVWLPSSCYMCFGGQCGIKVHRINGVIVGIEGDESNPMNRGRLCAKGSSGLVTYYNPHRVMAPLKRRNSEKGIGIDPKWEAISWNKAMDIIVERLGEVKRSDPRKLIISTFDTQSTWLLKNWVAAFGTPNIWFAGAGFYCGNGEHPMMLMSHGTFLAGADLKHTKYCLEIGTGFGHMVQHLAVFEALEMAEARNRGMKLVVVDPVCSHAASKADEWIPIRPGTDAAFALGVANVLINERNCYDDGFLKRYTNAPYLVGPDGHYVRDSATGKPLVWDSKKGEALSFDSPDLEDASLLGNHVAEDVQCSPAFQLLKEHLMKYTLERCSSITTVPAKTIRRVAQEMGEAASIGSTITINGKTLPLRPVVVDYYRGPSQHKHGWWGGFSVHLLNIILGAMDVPGGHLGLDVVGPDWSPKEGPDGFIISGCEMRSGLPYPPRSPKRPETAEILELFPVAVYSRPMFLLNLLEPRFGLPYSPEILVNKQTNFLANTANPDQVAAAVRKIPFMVAFALDMSETAEFADIVLPDMHYLERLDPMINGEYIHPHGLGPWYWAYRLPVVNPPPGVMHWLAALLEWADRLGFIGEIYKMLNVRYGLDGKYKLDPSIKYSYEDIVDLISRGKLGKDLDWIKQHGFVVTREKTVEEAYSRPFHKGRMPVYLEHLPDVGQQLNKFTKEELNLKWDTSDYQALPDWKPCPAYEETDPDYDLYIVNYKVPRHTHTQTADNPLLRQVSEKAGRDLSVQINPTAAARKNLKDGDTVWVESKDGARAKAVVMITDLVHEEVLGVAGGFSKWAGKTPQSGGNDFSVNAFIPLRLERIDHVSAALDACVKVKIYKTRETSTLDPAIKT